MIADKPALVMPFYDPNGTLFQHLQKMLPDIKDHFGKAYLTVPDEPMRLGKHSGYASLARKIQIKY